MNNTETKNNKKKVLAVILIAVIVAAIVVPVAIFNGNGGKTEKVEKHTASVSKQEKEVVKAESKEEADKEKEAEATNKEKAKAELEEAASNSQKKLDEQLEVIEKQKADAKNIVTNAGGTKAGAGNEEKKDEVEEEAKTPVAEPENNGSSNNEQVQPVEQPQTIEQPQAQPASQPTQNDTAKAAPKHTHNWVEVTQVVHHDAVTHTEQVQVGTEPIIENHTVCDCGAILDNMTGPEILEHQIQCGEFGYGYGPVKVGEKPIYENQTIVDQEAYDETVVVGYKCECGATK